MSRKLFANLSAVALILVCFCLPSFSFAQAVTLTSVTGTAGSNGLSSSPVYPQATVVLYGLGITTNGNRTIDEISIPSGLSNLTSLFNNAKLYRSTSSTYSSGSVTQVAGAGVTGPSITISSNNITITNLSENIQSTTFYYYLVVDYIYAGATNVAGNLFFNPVVHYGNNSTVTAYAGSPYYEFRPVSLNITSVTGGLSSSPIYPKAGVALYGFSAITPGGTATVTQLAFSGTNNALSTYFSNAKLYRSNNSSYDGSAVQIAGAGIGGTTATVNAGNITFSGLSESANSTQTKYYFLVLDYTYAGSTQSNATFHTVTPTFSTGNSVSYQSYGTYYGLYPNTFTVANLTGGIAATDLYYGDSNKAVFGIGVTSLGSAALTTFNFTSNNANLSSYFTGKLYVNTTATYGTGTATEIGTVNFNGSNIGITGLNEQFTNNETKYYFLVVTDIYYSSSNTPQVQFTISNNTANTFVTAGNDEYKTTGTINSATFTLRRPAPTLTVTGINSAINGITQGSLSYGQTGIVLFGFKVEALGIMDINELRIQSNVAGNNLFTNGKLYRSTTPYFANATQVSGNFAFNSPTRITGMNEQYTTYQSPTVYYYFVVADLTATTYFTPGTFQYNFENGQVTFVQTSPYLAITNISTSNGVAFNVVNSYRWVGTTSDDFGVVSNFKDLAGNNVGQLPNANIVVEIGVATYTNAPVVKNSTTIGGLVFGTNSPTLTINTGVTLTSAVSLNTINGASPTINGPGSLTLSGTANSTINNGSVLTLNNTTLNNAGTFTAMPTSVINLTNNANIANTGTFTLTSNVDGTAAIGQINGSSNITGNVTVERYVSGGSAPYRGYRLFSSPVYEGTVSGNKVYGVAYTKNSAYITGTTGTAGGFDATATTPTIYLYREDKTPSASATGGNFRGVNKINNTPTYDLGIDNETGNFNIPVGNGFMFFFRGNRATNASTSTSAIPDPVIFSNTGTLNVGSIVVKNWYTPGSSNLGYTASNSVSARGYNLVGNPYASTIDWDTFSPSSPAAGIYGPNVGNTIYSYNATSKTYATYNQSVGTNNGSRYIASGQGFYVLANSTGAALTFTEAAKAPTQQSTGNSLLMATAVPIVAQAQFIRLQLSRDDINKEDAVIQFNKSASNGYLFNEDSPYLRGSNTVSLSTLATDNSSTTLAINKIPFPNKSVTIPLNISVTTSGTYQLKLSEIKNMPDMFDIWLKDAFANDSLDIKTATVYNFNVQTTNASTLGSGRLSLVIRPVAEKAYKLLSFNASASKTDVKLTWTTENEKDNTFFALERSINKGATFEILDNIKSSDQGSYTATDKFPVTGENIYRLKQEDFLGNISYSNSIPIIFKPAKNNSNPVSVYPNPASSQINIAITPSSTNSVAKYQIEICNTTGKVIKQVQSASVEWQGSVADLLPGAYFIRVINTQTKQEAGRTTFIKI